MTSKNAVDVNGRKVFQFTSKIQNLGRVAELTDAVIDIALSGAWRDYQFATGRERWRAAEFDYFLIANDMRRDDVARVLAYNQRAKLLDPMMDRTASPENRRPFEQAAAEWNRLNIDLVKRARELGWITDDNKFMASPVPRRAQTQARKDATWEQSATRNRRARIPATRRRELDQLAKELRNELDTDERRYLIEQLKDKTRHRPTKTDSELIQWRADVEQIGRKPTELAKYWGISRSQAHRRIERIGA